MGDKPYTKRVNEFYESLNKVHKIPSKEEFKKLRDERDHILGLPVARELVEMGEIDEIVEFFTNIKVTKGFFRGKVLFSISGYDDDKRELFEIEEVMKWTRKVIEAVPYIFYYVHQESWAFMICSLGERLTVVKPKGFEDIDMEEVTRRQFMGEELPKYQSKAEVTAETKNHVLRGIKHFGYEIGDVKHTLPLLMYIESKLPLLEE